MLCPGEVQSMRPVVEQSIQQLTAQEDAMQNVSTQFNEALALYRKSVSVAVFTVLYLLSSLV